MSNIEEDVIDVIAFLAFHQSISNSFQKEKQTNCNKEIYNKFTTNYNKLCYKKKCNIDISIYRYKLPSSVFICLGLFVKIYIPRDHTH